MHPQTSNRVVKPIDLLIVIAATYHRWCLEVLLARLKTLLTSDLFALTNDKLENDENCINLGKESMKQNQCDLNNPNDEIQFNTLINYRGNALSQYSTISTQSVCDLRTQYRGNALSQYSTTSTQSVGALSTQSVISQYMLYALSQLCTQS
ncbi:hypothetical protein Tco_1167969, partial [Tanacetum coccineum]